MSEHLPHSGVEQRDQDTWIEELREEATRRSAWGDQFSANVVAALAVLDDTRAERDQRKPWEGMIDPFEIGDPTKVFYEVREPDGTRHLMNVAEARPLVERVQRMLDTIEHIRKTGQVPTTVMTGADKAEALTTEVESLRKIVAKKDDEIARRNKRLVGQEREKNRLANALDEERRRHERAVRRWERRGRAIQEVVESCRRTGEYRAAARYGNRRARTLAVEILGIIKDYGEIDSEG